MKGRDTYMITQLRQKIRSLENDKMILEKKLKFENIIGNMRSSTKLQEEELFSLKKQILDLQRENQELKKRSNYQINNSHLDEELKTIRKMLKNEKKMHDADIAVLSNLQSVSNIE
jgi:hypothetical protein